MIELDASFLNLLALYWDGDKTGFHRFLISKYLTNTWKSDVNQRMISNATIKIVGLLLLPNTITQRNKAYSQLLDLKLTSYHHQILQTILLKPNEPIYPETDISEFILLDQCNQHYFQSPTGKFSYQEIFERCYIIGDSGFIFEVNEDGILTLRVLDIIEWEYSKIIKPGIVNRERITAEVNSNYK